LENALIYFIAGRYEFHDKGIDIFINALGKLNEILKEEKSNQTIISFFFVPGNIRGIKPSLLESKTKFKDIKDQIDENLGEIKNRIIHSLVSKEKLSQNSLFDKEIQSDMKTKIAKLTMKGTPPLSTHDLFNEDQDAILNAFKYVGLLNRKEDNVKVIFYPIYLTGADGLLDTSYYESMLGSHLGVFPSFYEPWGYTPLEAAALGVGSVTTDLAGFGRYICKECTQAKQPGVFTLKRFNKSDEDVTKELIDTLHNFTHLTKQQRVENKITARNIAKMADWKFFIKRYIEAHNLALKK
jgi:glycogen(starch) synthase